MSEINIKVMIIHFCIQIACYVYFYSWPHCIVSRLFVGTSSDTAKKDCASFTDWLIVTLFHVALPEVTSLYQCNTSLLHYDIIVGHCFKLISILNGASMMSQLQ